MLLLDEIWTQSVILDIFLKNLKQVKNLKFFGPCDGGKFFEKNLYFANFEAPISSRLSAGESYFGSFLERAGPPLYNEASNVYTS